MVFVLRARALSRVLATVISLTFGRANYTLRRRSDIASGRICTLW
jgi:hypothetical protein